MCNLHLVFSDVAVKTDPTPAHAQGGHDPAALDALRHALITGGRAS
jgi:hypothetical protein